MSFMLLVKALLSTREKRVKFLESQIKDKFVLFIISFVFVFLKGLQIKFGEPGRLRE